MARRARALAIELNWRPEIAAPSPGPTAPGAVDPGLLYDALIDCPALIAVTRRLFVGGHCAQAVEEAFKCLNNLVKSRSGLHEEDGASLMFRAFDPDRPVLRINRLRSRSERDEQAGYRQIMAGVMTGLRNPRAHDHGRNDGVESALEMLVLANHLMRILDGSTRVRRPRGAAPTTSPQ